jgi:hypothetical protein
VVYRCASKSDRAGFIVPPSCTLSLLITVGILWT